jgi:hypothetical protein
MVAVGLTALGQVSRPRRVVILLMAVVCLSLGDLILTLEYLRTVGLMEVNPIARYLLEATGSAWALAAYKLMTLGVCVGLLYRLRSRLVSEIAAWLGLVVLALTAMSWQAYAASLEDPAELVVETYAGMRLDGARPTWGM